MTKRATVCMILRSFAPDDTKSATASELRRFALGVMRHLRDILELDLGIQPLGSLCNSYMLVRKCVCGRRSL
jgi:hypothetical protein